MEIVFSTRNPSKMIQARGVFDGSSITVLSLDDVGIVGEGVEDGHTLEENAFKKALFARERTPERWVMAEDTGLYITVLGGAPGLNAARWAGESATTDEITEYTLNSLKGERDRSAIFRTVVSVLSPDGKHHTFIGKIKGTLLEVPRTKPQPKMPYSGIFQPDGSNKVWAEMSVEYENAISHRGKAFRQARTFLEKMAV